MITGIYESAGGLDSLARMQEVVANNLANVSTDGFKRDVFQVEQNQSAPLAVHASPDLSPGVFQVTNQTTNLALSSEGFFQVTTPNGPAYTRNGNFQLDSSGRLVSKDGFPVQGQQGDIVLESTDFKVTEAGEVLVKGTVVDHLQVVQGNGPMRRLGNSLMTWEDTNSIQPIDSSKIKVLQGSLEGSNVNVVDNMINLMSIVRLYESNQKAFEAQDATLKMATTEVGRVA
jgi:flagellar basal-body rod protein FlgG